MSALPIIEPPKEEPSDADSLMEKRNMIAVEIEARENWTTGTELDVRAEMKDLSLVLIYQSF